MATIADYMHDVDNRPFSIMDSLSPAAYDEVDKNMLADAYYRECVAALADVAPDVMLDRSGLMSRCLDGDEETEFAARLQTIDVEALVAGCSGPKTLAELV